MEKKIPNADGFSLYYNGLHDIYNAITNVTIHFSHSTVLKIKTACFEVAKVDKA